MSAKIVLFDAGKKKKALEEFRQRINEIPRLSFVIPQKPSSKTNKSRGIFGNLSGKWAVSQRSYSVLMLRVGFCVAAHQLW